MQTDLRLTTGSSIHLRLDDALTIAWGPDHVDTFERDGRLVSSFRGGRHLRRGLDGRILARWRDRKGQRRHQWLSPAARAALMAQIREEATLILESSPDPQITAIVQRVRQFDAEQDARRFQRIYKPVTILPPDQYQALVLQATEGCSFNTCTFCALYRDRPFRIKTPTGFATHVQDVIDFLGEGLRLRRSIFLADANALIIPQPRLLALLDVIDDYFHLMPADVAPEAQRAWLRAHPKGMRGIYAFVDGFSAERKSVEEYRLLARRGLRRVYLGLESGCESLLSWLRKPSSAQTLLDSVRRMKQAGLQVGVIVLLGVGGERFDVCHRRDTAAILNAMPLDRGDIIYFSPFASDPAAPYDSIASAEGIAPPTESFMQQQMQDILQRLTWPGPPRGPKRVPYYLRNFVY